MPEELVAFIKLEMQQYFDKHSEDVDAELVGDTLAYGQWLKKRAVHFYNCFVKRDGIDAPHSFTF